MLDQLWLVPLFPALGFLLNGILSRRHYARQDETVSTIIGIGSVAASFLVALTCFWRIWNEAPDFVYHWKGPVWIEIGALEVLMELQLDRLSATFMMIITGVGLLIHIYSRGYMHGERSYYRFFTYMNLFMAAMLVLVLGGNFLLMFVGWEGVGLCSYLLIGFYFETDYAPPASKKAFVTNRVGDFGFVLGIFLIFHAFGTLNYQDVFAAAPSVLAYDGLVVTCITMFLFIGAMGKSAQMPLYIWLPDAMAGPTPCSALIHAATMVTSGIYMLARCHVLVNMAPATMMLIAAVGCITAFFAASIGLVQKDIKKVLAYSTVSQLGYMIMACGIGAYFAGVFHVMTHAFFKALLFMGAGAIIHGMANVQDMDQYGGLRKYMPNIYRPFFVAWLAICGIVPFAGFFSKDEILFKTFTADAAIFGNWRYVFWGLGVLTAGMTAFYMSRLMFLTFFGEERFHNIKPAHAHGDDHGHDDHGHGDGHFHPHDATPSMFIPLYALAILSFAGGWVGIPEALGGHNKWHHNWLGPVIDAEAYQGGHHAAVEEDRAPWFVTPAYAATDEHAETATHGEDHGGGHSLHAAVPYPTFGHMSHGAERMLMVVSSLVAVSGIGLAWFFYIKNPNMPMFLAWRLRVLHNALVNKWYVDEMNEFVVIKGTKRFADLMCWLDVNVVNGMVDGAAGFTKAAADGSIWVDQTLVDGAVNGAATRTEKLAMRLRKLQTGHVQNYGMAMLVGFFMLAVAYMVLR